MPRVVKFYELGGPEVLRISEEPSPEPSEGELRVRVRAFGLNRAEAMWRSGKYIENAKLPARLGYEAAGTVDAVGPGVLEYKVGDAINVVPAFGMQRYGMYGEVALAPVSAVVRHPESLSFTEAASIWMMFITVYGAFVEKAKISAGDVILIPAASSSVGLAAIQVANYLGAVPVALTRSDAKRARLLAAGAAHVIVTGTQDVVAEVGRITQGSGVRLVFDPVGGPMFPNLIRSVAAGGLVLIYGALSEEVTPLPLLELQIKTPIVTGYVLWPTVLDPLRLRAAVDFTRRGIGAGTLRPIVDRVFQLDEIVAAHRYLEGNNQFGKVVVAV
jgi:NADPH:quinone reductase-like Zn-dependent oxidoreductase